MFFLNHSKDNPLFQELLREGVLSAALWESLGLPAEGHLMDVLMGNRSKIPVNPWIDWLIRKHNCTRVPSIEPDYDFIKALDRQLMGDCLKFDCYPLRLGEGHLWVGIGRPDYPELVSRLQTFYKKPVIFRNALSLNDLSVLRNLCKEAQQSA